MKLQKEIIEDIVDIGEFESIEAGISQESLPFVLGALSDNLYSNKFESIVRELCSNMHDTTEEANSNKPYYVIFDKNIEDDSWYIKFKDYGTGLSPDDIKNIYMVYGNSSRRNSDVYLGSWGLGSKSPLSYNKNNFYLNTVVNNIKYEYIYFKTETLPTIDLLNSYPVNEQNGTEIIIKLIEDTKKQDYVKFINACKSQLRYFSNVIVINNINYNNESFNNDFKIYNHKYFKYCEYNDNLHIVFGQVKYEVDFNKLNLSFPYSFLPNIGLYFKIGELDVTLSRENLKYTKKTIKALENKFNEFYKYIFNYFDNKIIDNKNLLNYNYEDFFKINLNKNSKEEEKEGEKKLIFKELIRVSNNYYQYDIENCTSEYTSNCDNLRDYLIVNTHLRTTNTSDFNIRFSNINNCNNSVYLNISPKIKGFEFITINNFVKLILNKINYNYNEFSGVKNFIYTNNNINKIKDLKIKLKYFNINNDNLIKLNTKINYDFYNDIKSTHNYISNDDLKYNESIVYLVMLKQHLINLVRNNCIDIESVPQSWIDDYKQNIENKKIKIRKERALKAKKTREYNKLHNIINNINPAKHLVRINLYNGLDGYDNIIINKFKDYNYLVYIEKDTRYHNTNIGNFLDVIINNIKPLKGLCYYEKSLSAKNLKYIKYYHPKLKIISLENYIHLPIFINTIARLLIYSDLYNRTINKLIKHKYLFNSKVNKDFSQYENSLKKLLYKFNITRYSKSQLYINNCNIIKFKKNVLDINNDMNIIYYSTISNIYKKINIKYNLLLKKKYYKDLYKLNNKYNKKKYLKFINYIWHIKSIDCNNHIERILNNNIIITIGKKLKISNLNNLKQLKNSSKKLLNKYYETKIK